MLVTAALLALVSAGSLIRLRPQRFPRIDEEQILESANIEDDTRPRKNFSLGSYRVPLRYGIYMNITVHGIKPVRSNIMHFSKDGQDFATAGSRMPAIYLAANSSVLVFAVGQEVYNLTALVVGQETFVAIKCYDENRVRVSYHGKEVSVFEPKTHRMSGYANFYLGNPWEEPADVSVNTLRFFDRAEIRWKGRNKSNETYGAVLTEEPIPSWAYEETRILQEIYSANGFKLPQLTNGVYCHNRSIDLRVFHDVCSNGYLQSLWLMGFKLLPESIGKLQYLKELHITHGVIKILPASIGNLSSLEKL